jgi:plastocyanin
MRVSKRCFAILAMATGLALMCPILMFGGTISGKVTYTGTPAKQKPIDMSKEPSCAKQHNPPIMTEGVVTGANNTLDNVVIYISAGADDANAPAQAVTFTQKGCQYMPHVLAMHTGQELDVVNDDQTSHNIHPLAKVNREWNKSQPPGTPPIKDKWDQPEFIEVKCNIHPWMHGWFAVLKTNHYAITSSDGTYTLPDLPAGKYTITAWHEGTGGTGDTKTQDVTIGGSETKTVDFSFVLKPY